MNIGKTLIASASAFMLLASPVVAQGQADRASAPAGEFEQLEGENGIFIALLAAAAVIAGIIIIADDDEPVSP
jgi:hypothetical protein